MEYITAVLGVKVIRKEWNDINKLPYFLLDEYAFELVQLDDCKSLFIRPKENLAVINTVKKHLNAIKKICNLPVVVELDKLTRQKRKSLLENKISFVVTDKQLYLPFMGVVLQESFDSDSPSKQGFESLLPSAQMLLFAFIYGKCKPMYLSGAAKQFNITPMSVSRAANQLIDLNLLKVTTQGRSKILYCDITGKELFKKAKPYFINPVRKTVYIDKEQINDEMFSAGISALSELSMLNPPQTAVYGTVASVKNFKQSQALIDTDKQCVLEFWKYDATILSQKNQADILSLAMCFDKDVDERTQMEMEGLLEKVWE